MEAPPCWAAIQEHTELGLGKGWWRREVRFTVPVKDGSGQGKSASLSFNCGASPSTCLHMSPFQSPPQEEGEGGSVLYVDRVEHNVEYLRMCRD